MPEARAAVRVITSIDDPEVIEKVLAHLGETHAPGPSLIALQPESGAPPMPVDGWRLSSEGTPQGCEPGIGGGPLHPQP